MEKGCPTPGLQELVASTVREFSCPNTSGSTQLWTARWMECVWGGITKLYLTQTLKDWSYREQGSKAELRVSQHYSAVNDTKWTYQQYIFIRGHISFSDIV